MSDLAESLSPAAQREDGSAVQRQGARPRTNEEKGEAAERSMLMAADEQELTEGSSLEINV